MEGQHMSIVFLGHVDAGKSSLCGTILVDTKRVDPRALSQVEREAEESAGKSWGRAFLFDTDPEERRRGKTIEVGREVFEWSGKRWTILDAPGHRNYVPNAIEGIVGADICVLVISARKGEFEAGLSEEGQTLEHLTLVKAFGVPRLVVFINKMDSVGWDQKRYNEIVRETKKRLVERGFTPINVAFVPGSGFSSENVSAKFENSWWEGQCLLDVLSSVSLERKKSSETRFSVMSVQKEGGKYSVFGRVERGVVGKGSNFFLCPGEREVQILSINTDFCQEVPFVEVGENATLCISGVDEIRQGDFLCSSGSIIQKNSKLLCLVHVLGPSPLFCPGTECVMQLFFGKHECCVEKVLGVKQGEKFMKSLLVKKGNVGKVVITTKDQILVEPFEKFPKLGRFVIRDRSKTLAIGKVVAVSKK
ncbi:conserved putative translation elongation factor 1-alpha [Tokyovirus A1]|uniref:conserved putative translation elongation factor 1-alpha n=1 Tax=Tokyovirus A1 TaxID=1826170 RepID=UPI0007A9622A|nr:conserved putative translation elongation factor 1-alpha [Tokyovirus A1]BAU80076.1 conserved putative translation elongation factor 1-alpha [Tokyovirus A1]